MTDSNATELLCSMLDARGVEHKTRDTGNVGLHRSFFTEWRNEQGILFNFFDCPDMGQTDLTMEEPWENITPEQAVAATLGRRKAKSHPYGYERDTGAYDCTRCECGCINDISATYCNDCGGEIEIDMNAEKEFYEYNRNSVFVVKHDDGTLEFGGKRYVAATLGGERDGRTHKAALVSREPSERIRIRGCIGVNRGTWN